MKMARPSDPFWDFVTKLDDGYFKCTFCGSKFPPTTSVSRIKWHLSGVKGRGVRICEKVVEDIKDAAHAAIDGPPEKKHKAQNCEQRHVEMAQQGEHTPEAIPITGQANQADVGSIQVGGQGLEQCVREERICSQLEAANGVENTVDEHENRGEAINLVDRMASEPWDKINEVSTLLLEKENVENNSGRLAQPGTGASSFGVYKYNTSETRGDPLPTTKLVGQTFEENKNVLWSLLMDDEVSTIGIYGMGGVGKTSMLKHIYNEFLQKPGICNQVCWVTVSQDFSIKRVQNLIAKDLQLDLSGEDDDLCRAVKLLKELREKQKWILILDDMWKTFELEKVGIPIPLKGCKLIMTTRSERICQQMDSQHKIKVMPLSETEAWTLFMEKLGQDIALSPEVEQIAKVVARECAGLPLGIITLAGSLRGVDNLHEWRSTLKKSKESNFRDMEDKVLRILRFSYDQLDDLAIQQCLLYCALFPEDYLIEREVLIGYLIDEGIIKGMRSWQDAFDEGHTMLNRLENACLLESFTDTDIHRSVRMHDLIRDMAIQIQQENSQVIVKAGVQVKELPDVEEWTENLKRVSLMHNQIYKIPSRHSPRCPRLSTLLLQSNEGLRFIAGSFFEQLHGLKVLDLSNTSIHRLPASVSNLVSLTALLLVNCESLRKVPSLKKFKALKRLDLSMTILEKMPQGMKCLTNLTYLRMNGCGEKEFPSGILPKLSHLQVFVLETWITGEFNSQYFPVIAKQKEVACLRKLESLTCHFESHSEFVEFLKSQDKTQSLKTYKLFVGLFDEDDYLEMMQISRRSKIVGLGNLSINTNGDFQVMFPTDIQQLVIFKCNGATSPCHVSSLIKYSSELEVIKIMDCNMESLSSWFCSAPLLLPSCNGMFYSVKEFYCYRCHSMKKLFPLVLLPNLVNLEVIKVFDCDKMEEIAGTRSDEEGIMDERSSSIIEFNLPKLRILELQVLPELKSICSENLICHSLERITVRRCHKLKRMLICPLLHENGQPSPLRSLEIIRVRDCEEMEEVIGTRSDEEGVMGEKSNSIIEFNLPKLRILELQGLPELKSICSHKNGRPSPLPSLEVIAVFECEKMEETIATRSYEEEGVMGEESICSAKLMCNSLEEITVIGCQKLKRIPICLPLEENGQPSPPPYLKRIFIEPKEWWESVVEWEKPNAKDVLRDFVYFLD